MLFPKVCLGALCPKRLPPPKGAGICPNAELVPKRDAEVPGWPKAEADVAKLKGEGDEAGANAGVLAPNGDGEEPNGAAGCWPKAPVVPKAGVAVEPKPGEDCCPKMDGVVEPKPPPEDCPNAGAELKVPNEELPNAGVEAAPKGALEVAPKEDVPPKPASP
jgi:hypothetical protein